MSDIDFSISDGPVRILTWTDGECRPATASEIALWDRIEALERENAELIEAAAILSLIPTDERNIHNES